MEGELGENPGEKRVGGIREAGEKRPGDTGILKVAGKERNWKTFATLRNSECVILKAKKVENHGREGEVQIPVSLPPPGPAHPRIRLFSDCIFGWTKIIPYLLITFTF